MTWTDFSKEDVQMVKGKWKLLDITNYKGNAIKAQWSTCEDLARQGCWESGGRGALSAGQQGSSGQAHNGAGCSGRRTPWSQPLRWCSRARSLTFLRHRTVADQLPRNRLLSSRKPSPLFHKDGDGTVTAEEAGTVLRSLGQNPRAVELQVRSMKRMLMETPPLAFRNSSLWRLEKWKTLMRRPFAKHSSLDKDAKLRHVMTT